MNRYLNDSRSAYYGAWCALPLLAVYEALLWLAGPTHGMQVRNAADVWLRLVLESLGLRPVAATLVTMGLVAASIPMLRRGEIRLQGRYLAAMLGEAVVYSLALGIVINLVLYALVSAWIAAAASVAGLPTLTLPGLALPASRQLLTGVALSLGAGLFEEFAFRVVLLTVLLGLIFSLAHYGGALGEVFDLRSFLYRWLAGLLFTLLYYQRGFAITAYAHALYDVWVLLL
jgi:membrane protease YdiL (CAAX protease family)